MKICTTLCVLLLLANSSFSQCSVGGNGVVVTSNITIDGNMSDWTTTLNDPDNITYDNTPDTDAPISDVGRDFTRFAFTENISSLFLYFQRAGSVNNSVDLLFYLDVNNNGLMETNEPVVAISWSGSNGNAQVDIYNYHQSSPSGDVVSGDGAKMPGTLSLRTRLGYLGKGSSNGVSLEVALPFTELYKAGTTSNTDSLATTEQFKFHISSINGSVGSVPGSNSINDNFGGCFSGFVSTLALKEKNKPSVIKSNENLLKIVSPFYNSLTLKYETTATTRVTINIYNLSGSIIHSERQLVSKGSNTLVIDGASFPCSGLYIVETIDDHNKRTIGKGLKS